MKQESMNELVEQGYFIPAHKSLQEQILWCGVPREFMALNFTLATAIGLMLKIYPFLVINFILHVIAKKLTQHDPMFYQAAVRHIKEKRYFDV